MLISQGCPHQYLRWVQYEYHGVWGSYIIDLGQQMHDGGKPQFSLKFLLAPQLQILLADRTRLLKENLNAIAVLIKNSWRRISTEARAQWRWRIFTWQEKIWNIQNSFTHIHSHRLESIVVAGLSCSYCRAVLIKTSGESNTNILMKKADFYMTWKNPEYPKLIQTHRLESIVVAGLSCSYRRAVLMNTLGKSSTNIMAFGDRISSI